MESKIKNKSINEAWNNLIVDSNGEEKKLIVEKIEPIINILTYIKAYHEINIAIELSASITEEAVSSEDVINQFNNNEIDSLDDIEEAVNEGLKTVLKRKKSKINTFPTRKDIIIAAIKYKKDIDKNYKKNNIVNIIVENVKKSPNYYEKENEQKQSIEYKEKTVMEKEDIEEEELERLQEKVNNYMSITNGTQMDEEIYGYFCEALDMGFIMDYDIILSLYNEWVSDI